MDKKSAYQQKLEAQLDEWKAEILKLEAKAEEAQADAKSKYLEQLEEVRGHQKEAEKKLEELGKASGKAWEDMKSGFEESWSTMSEAMKKAIGRLE